ncbi:MAG: HEAT repeat domain-containing protein, partial [Gammaproteobacteria bacterium]
MIPSRNSSSRLSGYAVPFICMVLLLPFGAHGDTGRGNTPTRETRILHQLQSRHARERLQAIREAVSLPHLPHEIGSALMQLMEHDPDYKIRLFAIEQFGGCPAPSPLPEDLEQALAKALRDREPAIRRAAVQALAQDCLPAPQDQRTLRALATLLKDQDPVTRSFAAHALARSRPASDCSVVEGLTGALDDPDINVRISARQALARHLPGCPGGSERLAEYLAGAGDNAPDWIRGIAETYRSGIRLPPGHNSLATILRRRLEKSTSFPSDDLLDAAGAVLPASELALTLLELAIDHENWEDSLRGLLIERAVSTDSAALMKRREKVF